PANSAAKLPEPRSGRRTDRGIHVEMAKRISLARVPVTAKLGAAFGFVLLLLLGLAATSNLFLSQMKGSFDQVRELGTASGAALGARVALAGLRPEVASCAEAGDSAQGAAITRQLDSLAARLREAAARVGDAGSAALLDQLLEALADYRTALAALSTALSDQATTAADLRAQVTRM